MPRKKITIDNSQNFEEKKEKTYQKSTSKHKSFGVFLFFLIIIIIISAGVYFTKRYNIKSKQIENELGVLKNQITQNYEEKSAVAKKIEELQNKLQEMKKEQAFNNWNTYKNDELDFTFSYPQIWKPQNLVTSSEQINLNFQIDPTFADNKQLSILLIGNKEKENNTTTINSACAKNLGDIESFCKESCVKLNKYTAIDFRLITPEPLLYTAIAYSEASDKYPAICLEMNLNQIVEEKTTKEGKTLTEIAQTIDLDKMIELGEINKDVSKAIESFKEIANSIKKL